MVGRHRADVPHSGTRGRSSEAPGDRADLKHSRLRSWTVVTLGLFALALVLLTGLWGYARWANMVTPDTTAAAERPSPNGYDFATAALVALPPEDGQVAPGWLQRPASQLREAAAPARPVLDLLRDALQMEWMAPQPRGFVIPTPELSQFRSCARFFVAEAVIAESEGRFGDAIQRRLDAMELGSKVPRGGPLLHGLVGVAVHTIGFTGTEPLVPRLPAGEIAPALARVRRVRTSWPHYPDILEAKRLQTVTTWTRGIEHYQHPTPFHTLGFLWKRARFARTMGFDNSREQLRHWLTPKQHTFAIIDRYYRQLARDTGRPPGKRVIKALPADASPSLGLVDPQTIAHGEWQSWIPPVQLAMLETSLALRMHRHVYGWYPSRLADISRRWLPAVPRDPWGQPIVYRLENGRALVYSLGPDGKDDGARPLNLRLLNVGSTGDIVWGTLVLRRR
jgi:hypothetical protein